MKIKTKYYGIFYKNRGKWTGPALNDLLIIDDIIEEYGTIGNYLKGVRKHFKKKILLKQQIWE